MADWGRRTKYQAVTGVLLAWFAVGAAIYVAKPYLPAPKEQEELQDRGTFVREGAGPYIKWRPFDQQAIRLAKQTDKPILLVAGYAWSSISINWDSIFAVPDVAELVNKEFVPVRVDLLENPAWANAVLPLARAQRGDSRDYGIYVLTPEAKVLWAPSEQEIFSLNDRRLLGRLRHAHSLFGANIVRDEQAMQEGELSLIKGEIFNSPPDRAELLSRLTNSQSPYGGQSITIGIALRPPDWEFLMNHGGIEPVHEALRTMALSHRIDWLFGGVFDRLISTDPLTVEPIKTADANSGFLRVVARMSVHKPSDWIQLLLENQFDFVYEEFAQTDSPSFVGWEKEMRNRTAAHSFSPVQLARAVTSQDRLWAIENLGFDVQSNPQAMVSPKSAETIIGTQSRFEAILSQLREARSESEPSLRGDTSFSCRARAVSALLYSVRFLDDEARRARALAEFYELRDEMRIGVDDVAERAHPTIVVGTFPTYVAMPQPAWMPTN
ncbi:DUF255 domain-containing protein [Kamptonema cortianum]|nr:DUF255 domain-containing protein [Kamptonema cortianum]